MSPVDGVIFSRGTIDALMRSGIPTKLVVLASEPQQPSVHLQTKDLSASCHTHKKLQNIRKTFRDRSRLLLKFMLFFVCILYTMLLECEFMLRLKKSANAKTDFIERASYGH